MAVNNGSFVDEIYEQFLVCRMCSEIYKTPKVLTCMHTFCEKCLETHYEMEEQERPYRFLLYTRALSCPLCHSRTELPTGGVHRLPDNFLVANLADVVNRRKPSAKNPVCEICRPGSRKDETGTRNEADRDTEGEKRAVAKCLDCVKMLCRSCAELHRRTRVTQQHGLFDIQVEKDTECKLHPNEIIRFYCDPCEECICVLCTFHDHKDHDVSSLLEALDRHRGPFEELMERCRDRVERLNEQVELIDRCERGLRMAEEHIRDSAIESIAAIRRREKDLLAELRETLGDQTLEFIAKKDTFKENLKNLEGTFQLTNAMLKGTSIDLLMVKKEMMGKLTAILDSGVKKTPESLKRNVQLCDEDYYQDIRKAAFDHMEQTDCFISRNTKKKEESRVGEESKRSVEIQTTDDFFDFNLKRNISIGPDKTVDISHTKMGVTAKSDEDPSQKIGSEGDDEDDDDDDVDDPSEKNPNSVWQRPMAVVVVTEIPRSLGNIVLRPVTRRPSHADRMTQTQQIVLTERWTSMPKITFSEKETSTAFVHVLHKSVSTDNQTMVEKSTSTVVDVTAAYRGAASNRRMVMVSRGTCTPRMMMLDKETLPIPSSSANRGCSPVAWPSNTDNTHAPTSCPEDGLSAPITTEHQVSPQNLLVSGAGEDSAHTKGSLAMTENIVSNQGSVAILEDNVSVHKLSAPTEGTAANQKPVANPGSFVATQGGQMPLQKPVTVHGETVGSQGRVAVPGSQLSTQNAVTNQGSTATIKAPIIVPGGPMPVQQPVAAAGAIAGSQSSVAVPGGQVSNPTHVAGPVSNSTNKSPAVLSGVQMPVQRPVAIPVGNDGSQSHVAVPRAQVPAQRPVAVPLGNNANQGRPEIPGGQTPNQASTAVPKGGIVSQIPVAVPAGQIPAQRSMPMPGSYFGNQGSLAILGVQVSTQNPAAVSGGNVGNQSPSAVSGCQAPAQKPIAVPEDGVGSQRPTAVPGGRIPTQTPMPVTGSIIANKSPMAVTGSQVPTQRSVAVSGGQVSAQRPMTTVPGSNVPNQFPLAIPGGQVLAQTPVTAIKGNVANQSHVTFPGSNVANQSPLAAVGSQTPPQRHMTFLENIGVNRGPVSVSGIHTPAQNPVAAPEGGITKQGHTTIPVSQVAPQRPSTVPGDSDPKQGTMTIPEGQSLTNRHVAVTGGNTSEKGPVAVPGYQVPSQRPSVTQGEVPNQIAKGNTFSQNPVANREGNASFQRSTEFSESNQSSHSLPGTPQANAPTQRPAFMPEENTLSSGSLPKPGDPISTRGNVVRNADHPMTFPRGQASAPNPVGNSNSVAPNVLGKSASTPPSAVFPSTAANHQISKSQTPEQPK